MTHLTVTNFNRFCAVYADYLVGKARGYIVCAFLAKMLGHGIKAHQVILNGQKSFTCYATRPSIREMKLPPFLVYYLTSGSPGEEEARDQDCEPQVTHDPDYDPNERINGICSFCGEFRPLVVDKFHYCIPCHNAMAADATTLENEREISLSIDRYFNPGMDLG